MLVRTTSRVWEANMCTPSLEIFAFFMLTGVLSTTLIPETSHKSLEMLSNESQEDFIQGTSISSDRSSRSH